jgi:hypothetical protein
MTSCSTPTSCANLYKILNAQDEHTTANACDIHANYVLYFYYATTLFSMSSTATPLPVEYLTAVATVLLGALAAIVYYEHKSSIALCQNKSLREDLAGAQIELSLTKEDLCATQTKLTNTELCLADTESVLATTQSILTGAETALDESQRRASAHSEFRDALCEELSSTRTQRDRAEGGLRYYKHTLEETKRKNHSKEDESWDLQNQIQFKAKELQGMTRCLMNTTKELGRAIDFSQEAQNEIDQQHAQIVADAIAIERKEQRIQDLLEQVGFAWFACDRRRSTIMRARVNSKDAIGKLELENEALHRDSEYWRGMNESWKKNNAGTIHAMQSRINELEGELAESKEDNESLARHLRSMVERVESYIEELEALDLKAKQREWDVLTTEAAEKVLAESNTVAKEEDEEDEEEEEEEEEDDDDRWALDGDSDDDATVYELDEDSEEEEPEWFTHAPKDTKGLPCQQMREDALRMRVMLKAEAEELKEWNTDDVTLGERENETEDLEYDTASQDENEDLKERSAVDENEEFTEFDTEDYVVLWSDNEDLEEWGAEDDTLVWSETEAESENETEQKTEENEDLNGSCMENEKVANRWSDDEDEDEDEDLLIIDDWKADSEAVKCVW